jgi:hypothetical protein
VWRAAWIVLVALPACYESASRSGPLAGLADTLFPRTAQLRCEPVELRLPKQPRHRICGRVGDTMAFFSVGVGGRILSVVQNLPLDSTTALEVKSRREALIRQMGSPVYEGGDTHGNFVHYWHTDSLCASLYEAKREPRVQVSLTTPDFFGRCMS